MGWGAPGVSVWGEAGRGEDPGGRDHRRVNSLGPNTRTKMLSSCFFVVLLFFLLNVVWCVYLGGGY